MIHRFIKHDDRPWKKHLRKDKAQLNISINAEEPPTHLGFSETLGFGHLVGEVGLLEARGAHALVRGRVGARRRVRRVQAGLDQSFARLAGDHGLQLTRGERVDVTRLAGHQQQDLSSRERGELVRLQTHRNTRQTSENTRLTETQHIWSSNE